MSAGFVGILRASNNEAESVSWARDALWSVVCRPSSATRHRLHIPFPIDIGIRNQVSDSVLIPDL